MLTIAWYASVASVSPDQVIMIGTAFGRRTQQIRTGECPDHVHGRPCGEAGPTVHRVGRHEQCVPVRAEFFPVGQAVHSYRESRIEFAA
ncbi:MAG TPA: hypothetical protein VFX16_07960 [Pseudonocardiaceae bacterium]|nr:hypothetical protein [Pseudonocardiaceae bacterium]